MFEHIEADPACGFGRLAVLIEQVECAADRCERRIQGREQIFPCRGKGDAAAGAVDQPHAEARLHRFERVAQRGGADAKLQARMPKVAMARDGEEGSEIGELGPVDAHRGSGRPARGKASRAASRLRRVESGPEAAEPRDRRP